MVKNRNILILFSSKLHISIYFVLVGHLWPVMPDSEANPATELFFARFEDRQDFPTPRQSGITAFIYFWYS